MPKILVTGASGRLGSALMKILAGTWNVRALLLPGTSCNDAAEIVFADVCNPETLPACLENVDAVLHMAGLILSQNPEDFFRVNTEGTRNVAEACRQAGIRRLVYVSSVSVEYPERNPYAESKFQAENIVRQSGLDWTIVRPTLLVGAGGGAEYRLFTRLSRFPLVFLPENGNARKRPVHVDDLAEGLCALMNAGSQTFEKCYALAGRDIYTLREMLQALAHAAGRKSPRILNFPAGAAEKFAGIIDRFFLMKFSARQALMGFVQDAAPSIEPAERDFGFSPRSLNERW